MAAIRKEERIGGQRLILGDCLDVMPTLGMFDAVIWDPPWGIGFAEYNTHKDDEEAYPQWIRSTLFLSESHVQDGWFLVFQGPRRAWEWSSMIERPYRIMACAKNFTQILPGAGPLWSTDFALFWPVGVPLVEHGRGRDFHVAMTSDMRTRPKGHPCPRPLDQIKYVTSCFTESGMSVLDPTMGSGTTLVACQRLGRNGTGIEIDPDYFDSACKRVEEASRQRDLFIDPPAKPTQEALDV